MLGSEIELLLRITLLASGYCSVVSEFHSCINIYGIDMINLVLIKPRNYQKNDVFCSLFRFVQVAQVLLYYDHFLSRE